MKPTIHPETRHFLADRPWSFSISNPNLLKDLILDLSLKDDLGETWKRSFNVPKRRLWNTHMISNPMVLMTSMQPIQHQSNRFYKKTLTPLQIQLTLKHQGRTLDRRLLQQEQIKGGVEIIPLHEGRIRGKLFLPKSAKSLPAILLLGGSSGSLNARKAALLASRGFAVLALAYFRYQDLPPTLESIPLEYFMEAVAYLKNRPEIDKGSLSLLGVSRGGDLVLNLASYFPDAFQSVVAIVPSSVTYGGYPDVTKPSWTLDGKPLPIAPFPTKNSIMSRCDLKRPVKLTPFFFEGMKESAEYEKAMIPVERIKAPLLLISGHDDQMWPSDSFCRQIMERLEKCGSTISRKHLSYPYAGHTIAPPYFPTTISYDRHPVDHVYFDMGGTPEGTAHACEDSWHHILQFLSSFSGASEVMISSKFSSQAS